jgi:molybdate transport system substrate-binding protein
MLRCVWVWFLLLPLCGVQAAEVHVFAAASLTHALREIGTNYFKQSGDKLVFNFGASSLLARQIEQGAPADIFFSADEEKMDYLQERNLIAKETRRTPLSNLLVIVISKESRASISSGRDLTNAMIKRLALAEPKTVPAGIYAKKYLEKIGLWGQIAPKVIPTENVRGALSAVESGNADAAIVYHTDAASSEKVRVAYQVPLEETPDITYPVAVLKGSKDFARAKNALDHLVSSAALEVFRKHGFIVRERP